MDERERLARRFVAQCRETNPGDPRTDAELMGGPFGGYATADAVLAMDAMKAAGMSDDAIEGSMRGAEAEAGLNPLII